MCVQPRFLRPRTDDERAHVATFPAQPRDRAQHVLVSLFPDEPAGREDEVRSRRIGLDESRGVDAGRRDLEPVLRRALEHEHAASALGRGQEQVDTRDRLAALPLAAKAPIRVRERDRLPDGEDEPKTELLAQERRAVAVRNADLGGVDDVGATERRFEPQVSIPDDEGRGIADTTRWKPVADRPHALDRERQPVECEGVRAGDEHAHVVAVGQTLPGAKVPRIGGVTPQENDA